MQHVGMADQHRGPGIPQDEVDLFRLEVPVDRHAIGAQSHRPVGCLDEGDVVAHQDADAVALPDAKLVQSAGDTSRAIGDLNVGSLALTADDAEEGGGSIGHCLVRYWRTPVAFVITGLVPVIHAPSSVFAKRTWMAGT